MLRLQQQSKHKAYYMTQSTTSHNYLNRGSAPVFIIVALVIVVMGALGFVFWNQVANTDSVEETITNNTEVATPNQSNIYTSDDPGTYVRSFEYPSNWTNVNTDDACKKYDLCFSPPVVVLANENDSIAVRFTVPQSASDQSIDQEATRLAAANGGVIDATFTSIDGIAARKIQYPDDAVVIAIELRGGFGYINFRSGVTEDIVNSIVSSWKWA